MTINLKYALLIFLLSVICINSFSQNFNNYNQDYSQISAFFRHEDLIVEPEETFFNILTVVNNNDHPQVVIVDFNAPMGWSVIKEERRNYTIEAGDSLKIPIRVAATRDVKGEIGYSIIASVNDRDGQSLANAYCYVKIPSVSNLNFRPITRVAYFDRETAESQFSFRFTNRGNIDELINITLTSSDNVSLPNERNNTLAFQLRLESGRDTTITLRAEMLADNNQVEQTLYRVDLEATSDKERFSASFWFNHLISSFRQDIPPGEIPLSAELMIHNLFSEHEPYFSGSVNGNILFTERRDINYRIMAYGIGRTDNFLRRSRFRVAYNAPDYNIEIGDIAGIPVKYGFGRGVKLQYRFLNNYQITGLAGENQFRPIRSYGGILDSRWSSFNLNTRFAYTDNQVINTDAKVFGARTNFSLFENHNFTLDAGVSEANFKTVDHQEIGYGFTLNYTGRINDLRIRLREQYGSSNYFGNLAGRHRFMGTIRYPYKDGLIFDLIGHDRKNMPIIETASGITAEKYHRQSSVNFRTTKYMDAGFALFFGPLYERRGSNSFFYYDDNNPFITNSAKFEIGSRIRLSHNEFFNPSLTLGYNFVTDYSIPGSEVGIHNLDKRDEFFNAMFSFNLKRGNWGAYLNYFYGPYGLNQQLSYFYNNIYTQNIRVMPYYENYIYEDIVKLTSKLNFMHDFTYKTSRIHMHNELDFYFDRGFTVTLLNTLGYQVSEDLITEDKYDYSSTYFEIRLKKDFHFSQPRIKYHDLRVHLFKDLDGNLEKDPNEPGVENILVTIHREDARKHDDFDKEYDYTGQIINNRLLSGPDGIVEYRNLPAGLYRIEINNIDSQNGTYRPDVREVMVYVNENKDIYIPFLERNKIFGQVILNRSSLSTLGRIDVSNIRVEAVDTRGNAISTLTDGQGRFELYAPSLDDYVVSIRNIFEEHFNLRQNDFVVHLNAYKQFEVNFVFDEKRRRIDFQPSEIEVDAEVISVRRTNLTGYAKDRTTLQNLGATIEIVDNETGRTIETTRSDRNTGRFDISFRTGENYSIIVTAPGYWMYSDRLELEQALTIQDVEREILLDNIIVGSKFELRNLVFEPGSAEIPNEAYPEIDRLIEQLKENPNVRIQIAGHSDGLETIEDREISQKRAEAVAQYMFEEEVGNIEYAGYQDSQSVAPDDTAENRARNRRVEITVVDK